jgi:ribose/xylose/arabinose/galactoside ABC-type transport system permease subunit
METGLSSSPLSRPRGVARLFQYSEVGLTLAILVVLALTAALDTDHNYLKNPIDSARTILRQVTMLGIIALGAAIVIIAGGIDLSSGSMIAFSGTACATVLLLLAPEAAQRKDVPLSGAIIALACIAAILSGFLVGSLHAWLITVINLPPFVATLATLVGLRSLSRVIVAYVNQGSTQISIPNERFRYLSDSLWIPAVICAVLIVIAWVLMNRTVMGRHLYALGGNENAARLSGVRTDKMKWLAYCISAVLSSIAGILYVAEVAVIEPETQGRGYELNAIAAAVVGGCSLQGGVGTIPGTVLGVVFLRVVMDSIAKVIKVDADKYEGLIIGIVVVFAVALTQLRHVGREGKRFLAGALGMVNILNLSLAAGVLAMLFGQRADLGGLLLGGIVTGIVLVVLMLLQLVERRQRESKQR